MRGDLRLAEQGPARATAHTRLTRRGPNRRDGQRRPVIRRQPMIVLRRNHRLHHRGQAKPMHQRPQDRPLSTPRGPGRDPVHAAAHDYSSPAVSTRDAGAYPPSVRLRRAAGHNPDGDGVPLLAARAAGEPVIISLRSLRRMQPLRQRGSISSAM